MTCGPVFQKFTPTDEKQLQMEIKVKTKLADTLESHGIAVITSELADKISFVYNCMQTRLRGQYNGK